MQGFDEYMNLVLDDAEEIHSKTKSRKQLGRSGVGRESLELGFGAGNPAVGAWNLGVGPGIPGVGAEKSKCKT